MEEGSEGFFGGGVGFQCHRSAVGRFPSRSRLKESCYGSELLNPPCTASGEGVPVLAEKKKASEE